jgi:hypothetical protein
LRLLNQWLSAPDANLYQSMAVNVSRYFGGVLAVIPPNLPETHASYPVLLGGIYYLLGPSPLWGIFFNGVAFLAVGFLAHRLAIQLGHPPSRALVLAVLATCWPLGLASSLTLLRESFFLLGVLGTLVFITLILHDDPRGRGNRFWPALGLIASLYLLVTLRPEMKWPTLAITLLGVGWSALQGLIRRQLSAIWWPVATCLLVLTAIWIGTHYPPQAMVKVETSPIHPGGISTRVEGQATADRGATTLVHPPKPAAAPLNDGFTLSAILEKRRAFASDGGLSLSTHAYWVVDGIGSYLFAAAVGWRDLLLYPYPWEGPPTGGWVERAALTVLILLWYACLPGVAWGMLNLFKNPSPAAGLLIAWVLIIGTAMAFIVVNLGTLFRMRDMVLIPALLSFSPRPYAMLASWWAAWRGTSK